jgi:hypothetical protein
MGPKMGWMVGIKQGKTGRMQENIDDLVQQAGKKRPGKGI